MAVRRGPRPVGWSRRAVCAKSHCAGCRMDTSCSVPAVLLVLLVCCCLHYLLMQELDLRGNAISEVPTGIGNLTALTRCAYCRWP